jgi:hypothetical protein
MPDAAERSKKWRAGQKNLYGDELVKKRNALRMRIYRKAKTARIRLKGKNSTEHAVRGDRPTQGTSLPSTFNTNAQTSTSILPTDATAQSPDSSRRQVDDDIYGTGQFQEGDVTVSHLVLKHPFTAIIAGPTGAGKTSLVTEILRQRDVMLNKNIEEVLWCYGITTTQHPKLKEEFGDLIKLHKGLPDLGKLASKDCEVNRLLILDDLMSDLKGTAVISCLFSRGSHHLNMSVVLIVQNLFLQSQEMRNAVLNAFYKVIFKNPSDLTQLQTLNARMYPGCSGFFKAVMNDAGKKNRYAYIVLDAHPTTPDDLRVRSNILPGEGNAVYLPA